MVRSFLVCGESEIKDKNNKTKCLKLHRHHLSNSSTKIFLFHELQIYLGIINKINIVGSIDIFGAIYDKFVALNRWHLIYINLYPDIDKFGALRILVALKLFVPNKMYDANLNFNFLSSDAM